MRTKSILSILILTAVTVTFSFNEAKAAFSAQVGTPNASFSISDYQSAPPNVYILNDRGRPYYMERNRRVYMERRRHGRYYRHHEDRGRDERHGRGDRHDH
jgi:hypothetical protein